MEGRKSAGMLSERSTPVAPMRHPQLELRPVEIRSKLDRNRQPRRVAAISFDEVAVLACHTACRFWVTDWAEFWARKPCSARALSDISEMGWCCERGLNSRPLPYQGSALPLSYHSIGLTGRGPGRPGQADPEGLVPTAPARGAPLGRAMGRGGDARSFLDFPPKVNSRQPPAGTLSAAPAASA